VTFTILLVIAVLAGFYMAWNIGANDVANAFGTSVGSGALTIRQVVLLAGVFEFCGAFLVGASVTDTIKQSIIHMDAFQDSATLFGLGMLAALIGSAAWLNIATYFAQPVSTTHAIIGAVIGFAVVARGVGCVTWSKMGAIAASWVVSPLVGGILAYLIYKAIVRFVLDSRHPVYRARQAVPVGLGAVVAIVVLSILYRGLPKLRLDLPLPSALGVAAAAAAAACVLAYLVIRHRTRGRYIPLAERYVTVERWFSRLQVITACYMAFAHGANDVANAIGPLAGCMRIFAERATTLVAKTPVPPWLLAFGGAGIVIGLATYGIKVIEAVGKKITEVTPTRGFSAEFATATTVLVCSKMGLPISTTFVLVGAVMGVGIARGFAAIDLKVIRRIFASWVVTIPVSAVLTAGIFLVLRVILHV
jgi:PiT family inorganic phosphate transporter